MPKRRIQFEKIKPKKFVIVNKKKFFFEALFRTNTLLQEAKKNYSSMGYLTHFETIKKYGVTFYEFYIHKKKLKEDVKAREAFYKKKVTKPQVAKKTKKFRDMVFTLHAYSQDENEIKELREKLKKTHYTQIMVNTHRGKKAKTYDLYIRKKSNKKEKNKK